MSGRARLAIGLGLALAAGAGIAAGILHWTSQTALTFEHEGQRYELLSPDLLAVVAIVPLLLVGLSLSLADLPRVQRWLAVLVRSLVIATLALALARPARTTDATLISTVFLVDVSDSVTNASLEQARARVQEAWAGRGENDVQLVTFARDARVVPLVRDAAEIPAIERHEEGGAGTNLEAALQLAYGLFPPGHLRRVVLLSDGGQTEGDLLSEASRAPRFGVTLFTHPYREGAPREVAVRELVIPDRLRVGEPFPVRARIFSTAATTARVRLYQGETLNGLEGIRDVELQPGDNDVELRSVVRVAGPVTYSLAVEPTGADRFRANNQYATTVVVPGRPSVLYVEGVEGRASHLASALTAGDFEVDVRSARAIPTSLRELERYDFFILSDVAADQVSLGQQDAIERYVRDLGGGFLMAGGESSFGLGGWQNTRIERLLPVRMDAERRRDQPSLAIALVIDKSGSMNGQKMELAKEAAAATAEMLSPDDYIEVIGFDSQPTRVVRMQSARNRIQILRDIGRLTARGGTAIFPALDMAYQDLVVTRARVKHVILLTDGQTQESGITELTQAMAAEGITISVVGLGADVNRALLQQVANLGGGRAYFTVDPHNIPRIFMRETSTVARSNVVEEYFRPSIGAPADFLRGVDMATAPYLHGYVATRAKPSPAQVTLVSELGEPILARWRVGLGWSLAWTSDVKNRWSVEWLRWPGYSRFWAQLVREHMRQRRRQTLDMTAEVADGEVRVTVDAIGADDEFMNDLTSSVHVEGPMGGAPSRGRRDAGEGPPETARVSEDHPLRQTAPGRYEARFPLAQYGSFVLTAEHRRDGRTVAESSAQLSNPYPREYMTLEPDVRLLERAATLTGGTVEPTVARLFDPGDERIQQHEELWPRVLFAALLLFVLDLALRRVRLFDRKFRAAPSARR
jgi:secreted protein with Ig-like and vWFA domain